jgi:hypothetical protein
MAYVLILIIPFHGLFLSLFFFSHTEGPPGSNFFLGAILLVLSFLSLYQLSGFQFACFSKVRTHSYLFYELLISPFLFSYTSNLIHPWSINRIRIHLLALSVYLTLVLLSFGNFKATGVLVAVIFIINIISMLGLIYLLCNFTRKHSLDRRQILTSEYAWIFILNLLVLTSLFISMGIYALCPVRLLYLTQIPKGFVVYYTYYKILNEATFIKPMR